MIGNLIEMPKKKADVVHSIRIELQESERKLLREAVTFYSVGRVFPAMTELTGTILSDLTAAIGIVTLYEMITGHEVLFGTPNDWGDLRSSWAAYRRNKKASGDYDKQASSLIGGFILLLENALSALFLDVEGFQERQENPNYEDDSGDPPSDNQGWNGIFGGGWNSRTDELDEVQQSAHTQSETGQSQGSTPTEEEIDEWFSDQSEGQGSGSEYDPDTGQWSQGSGR